MHHPDPFLSCINCGDLSTDKWFSQGEARDTAESVQEHPSMGISTSEETPLVVPPTLAPPTAARVKLGQQDSGLV